KVASSPTTAGDAGQSTARSRATTRVAATWSSDTRSLLSPTWADSQSWGQATSSGKRVAREKANSTTPGTVVPYTASPLRPIVVGATTPGTMASLFEISAV